MVRLARLLTFTCLLWALAAMIGVEFAYVAHAYRWGYSPNMTQLIIGVGIVCILLLALLGLFMGSRPDEYTGTRERKSRLDPAARDPKTGVHLWRIEKRGGRHRLYEDEDTRVMRRGGAVSRPVVVSDTGVRE